MVTLTWADMKSKSVVGCAGITALFRLSAIVDEPSPSVAPLVDVTFERDCASLKVIEDNISAVVLFAVVDVIILLTANGPEEIDASIDDFCVVEYAASSDAANVEDSNAERESIVVAGDCPWT